MEKKGGDENMNNSKTLTVQTENGEVVVRKLALGDYAELLRALKKLPSDLASVVDKTDDKELKAMSTGDYIEVAMEVAADHLPELCDVLAVATDKDSQF